MGKKRKYYQRPDGLYETSRTINGKRIKFRGRTCAEVDRKLLEFDMTKQKGRKVPVIADEWFEVKQKELRENSGDMYGSKVEALKEAFPGYAGDVKPLDLKRYLQNLAAKGYGRSTVNMHLTVIRQLFSHAVMQGDIDVSPAAELSLPKDLPHGTRRALTEDEEARVECCRTGKWWFLGLMFLCTGARRGEVCALDWQDLDKEHREIDFNKKLRWRGSRPLIELFLKSERGKRKTPMLDLLYDAIPEGHPKSGPVFPGAGGGYMTRREFELAWQAFCMDAGLVSECLGKDGKTVLLAPSVTPHSFRHSYATICFEADVDPKTAASYIGDTEEVMRGVYEELRERRRASGAGKINGYLKSRREKPEPDKVVAL